MEQASGPGPARAASGARFPLRFVGSGSEYFRIWVVNLLLIIVTLGLYYPFAKVRRLRYFHGATEVAGHPLSFHGEPWAMLRGYLLVGVMFAAYSVAGQFDPVAGLVALAIVAAIWPALWHSALRFRLANTGWRGLRLRFAGTRGGAYVAMSIPIALALLLSGLGLYEAWASPELEPSAEPAAEADERAPPASAPASHPVTIGLLALVPVLLVAGLVPVVLWLLKRYQHGHFALGATTVAFTARLRGFFGVVLLSGLVALALALLAGIAFGIGTALGLWGGPDGGGEPPSAVMPIVFLAIVGAYVLGFCSVGAFFTARLQNLCWNGTQGAQVGFESRLRTRPLAWLWLKNWVLIVLTLGLYFPFAAIASARMRLEAVTLVASTDLDTLVATSGAATEAAAGDAAGDIFGIDVGL